MTILVIDDDDPRVVYTVGGTAQSTFTVPFAFFDDDDLMVFVNDVLQSLTSIYTVSGAGDEGGGSITFLIAQSSATIVIERRVPYQKSVQIPASGANYISTLNTELSRVVAMIQQIDSDNTRTLKQPISDATDIGALPAKATRLGKFLFFNATTGDPEAADSVTGAAVSAFITTLLDDLTAAAARATLGITDQSSYSGLFNNRRCR